MDFHRGVDAMKRLVALAIVLTVSAGLVRAEQKNGAAGTWKWTSVLPSSNEESKLTLKRDGDKLTGVLNRKGTDLQIQDGKISGDEISFTVTPQSGQKVPVKYSGKIAGDTITGTMELSISGTRRTVPWKAWRSKD
jgi:hypothetical protein